MSDTITKKCAYCQKEKTLDEYYLPPLRAGRSKRYRQSRCNECFGLTQRKCGYCGNSFLGKAVQSYCSPQCRHVAQNTYNRCIVCDRWFLVRHKMESCSKRCADVSRRKEVKLPKLKKAKKATAANSAVQYAKRKGDLIPASACQDCGAADRRIEAAHYDYDEPLQVRWLCRSCHVRWDKLEPKGGVIPRGQEK